MLKNCWVNYGNEYWGIKSTFNFEYVKVKTLK